MKDKFENYHFPKDRKFLVNKTPNHLWIKESEEGEFLIIGLSDFFQKRIGELKSFKSMDTVGKITTPGKTLAIITAKNYSSILKHQLNGEIVELNDLKNNPKLVNSSPYEKGWVLKLKLDQALQEQLNKHWLSPDEKEFKSFIELEIKNNALLPDDCCPDFLGGSGVVRRRRKK